MKTQRLLFGLPLVAIGLAASSGAAMAEQKPAVPAPLEIGEVKAAVARAPAGTGAGVRLCYLSAYSRDRTRTNLRAGPGRDEKVLATLPPMRREDSDEFGPEFHVIAGKGDWFLIRGAHWAAYDRDEEPLALGPAWMAAGLMGVTIYDPALRREPREGAETVLEMRSPESATENWGPDSAKIEKIFGCSGSFLDVAVKLPDGRSARGWAGGLCANQVTTCGGVGPAVEERAGGLFLSEAACRDAAGDADCPPAPK